jgi:carbamoylphosphate synthase large subunit
MKRNVLVFPCGSEIGLEINRALANSAHFNAYGVNSINDHGKYVYKNYIHKLIDLEEPDFLDDLNKIIEMYHIDFIIPAHDSVNLFMAENQSEIKAVVLTSVPETCSLCRSKGATYEMFKDLIPTPELYNDFELLNYPVFLKPDVGQGTKGTYTVNSTEEIDFYLKMDPTILAMEYLPGKEYTVDCFTNKDGELLFAEGRVRHRISNGISINSWQIKNEDFQRIAHVINKTLTFRGVWFFQLKERANGELVLMEISPRIAGTMALFRARGVNFVLLSLFDRMGFDVSVVQNDFEIEIDRALFARFTISIDYDYVYVDFDDTIIVDNCVNTLLMKFLYQAKNSSKKIVLLTKHIFNMQETLDHFAISRLLFDEVIQIKRSENKINYINYKKSIFIDDSFEERRVVMQNLKIPTFGLDAVESLLSEKF